MKNKTGKLIILSAPSGAGKTTICKNLLSLNDSWKYSISATTRPMRENEIDGKDYHFLSKDKFEIIFIDNESTDNSIKILKKYKGKIKNLSYCKSGITLINWDKKMFSLSKGIELAKGNIIVHTDGDCVPRNNWLKSFYDRFCNPRTGIVISRTPLRGFGFWGKILELENLESITHTILFSKYLKTPIPIFPYSL